MCGFAGFTGYLENGKDVLTDMMNKIIHRGPDSAGQYIDDKAYMGFRRLSIIDLDNGSQPMFNENKKIVITFNGEIYNYQDLRKDLIEKGHIFANNSDTEVLIHAYEEYGEDMLNKLRGMFAFVIWDSEKETLFGARDFLTATLYMVLRLRAYWHTLHIRRKLMMLLLKITSHSSIQCFLKHSLRVYTSLCQVTALLSIMEKST